MRFSDLWSTEGTIDRGPYVAVGLIGFALKHNIDRFVATFGFGKPWGFFNYWISPVDAFSAGSLSRHDTVFLLTMLALSLPFIWVGVVLTLKRLRSVGLPGWCVCFFFLPFLNLLFFLILAVLPAHIGQTATAQLGAGLSRLDRLIPQTNVAGIVMGVVAANVLALPFALVAMLVSSSYGFALFVGLPFSLGLISVLVYAHHEPRGLAICLGQATLSVAFACLLLFGFAIEGVICLVMAAPLALPLAWIGGFVGYLVQLARPGGRPAAQVYPMLLLAMPSLMAVESAIMPEPPVFPVVTAVEIDADPQQVWDYVVAFSELPEPTEWLFRLGIAYPERAEIFGSGTGAERHCVFSTGSFVEPIEVWDEPRLLKFSVTSNPPPMQEWTPYEDVHPPHLEGFLVSNGGQFRLDPLPNGGTRIEGTTWYRHSLWPAGYWKLWSDEIIHRIHLRVLHHIKRSAEAEAAQAPSGA